jgi:hypothetical protein
MEDGIAVRDAQIADLKKQVAELTEERKLQSDFIAVRSNNASIYGLIKPPAIEEEDDPKDEMELKDVPATRARQFARKREAANMLTFRTEEDEADRLIRGIQEAGIKAAEEAAKGLQAQA